MIKLTVTYETPPDPAAFDAHYLGTHMPLCDKLPGIKRAEVTRFTAGLDGSHPSTTSAPTSCSTARRR